MPSQGRLGDKGMVPADAHGCPACPHPAVGPAIAGSPNVNVNARPALRVQDKGIHAACCGPNMWTAAAGSATVFINGKKAHRLGDKQTHCGGTGMLIEGSGNVFVGDATSSGSSAPGATPPVFDDPTFQHVLNPPEQPPPESQPDQPDSPSNPAAPDAPKNKKPDEPPKKVPAQWKFEWDDGTPVQGYRTHFQHSSEDEEQKLGGNDPADHSHGNYDESTPFHVEIHGTTKISGVVKSPDGNPVVGATVRIERAFGDPIETKTDSSGAYQADGFLKEEQHEVFVTLPLRAIDGVVKDHEGNPVENATVTIERAFGESITIKTDANGAYHAEGFVEDEPHEAIVTWEGKTAKVQLTDEKGKPIANAYILVQPDGGTTEGYTTDENGFFEIKGFKDDPWYRLAIVTASGVAEGTFVDEKGEPKAGVRARVIRASGPPIDVTSDGAGNYRAEGLVPGEDYVLEVVSWR